MAVTSFFAIIVDLLHLSFGNLAMLSLYRYNVNSSLLKCLSLRRSFSTSADLHMFPEYKEALKFEKEGQFAKALPLYSRVVEVVDSFGASSPMSVQATVKMANTLRYSGKFTAAIELLEKKAKSANIRDKVQYQQLIAVNALACGDDITLQAAESAVQLCESLEGSEWDIGLFSASYSVLGLFSDIIDNIDNIVFQD